ncbi:cystathionine beta-lyase [Bifidobacterium sp. DSM 109958]|uniref:cysteine-S-conjugate beta-lyase n=1 Tax=Bifidobacterium moraviense TaxID=2675323 RepID=A0A7Y0F0U9_9BIFI|nr:MalY/PatB family protein [Bifidobacterium sp. DSM 109958]NMM99972.1 cystathionine beta-lyase [Bifidobacterium sp. DSM 109958]
MTGTADFDFDEAVDRSNTNAIKWDEARGALPMWVADMEFRAAPAIREALQRRLDNGVFGYSGIPRAWNDAYAHWWRERHGLTIDPDALVFATGVIPAISSMVRKLTTPAENVLVMTPVYNIFFNSILNNGRNALASPLVRDGRGGYAIDWEDLESKLADPQTTLMILCNPHNPTGMVWDQETLARIGELCAAHRVTVISDEIHCDLTDPGVDYVPFAAASETCRRISATCMAPTKAFNIAGLHTAAVMADDPFLRHRIWRGLNTDEVAEPNAFAVDAAIAAFTQGGPWLDALRDYVAANKREAERIIDDYNVSAAPERRVTLCQGAATYLMWLDCSALLASGETTDALCEQLVRDQRVMVSPGSQYRGDGGDCLRINVACPRATMREGLRRMVAGLAAYPSAPRG